jgi:hypothetical protein
METKTNKAAAAILARFGWKETPDGKWQHGQHAGLVSVYNRMGWFHTNNEPVKGGLVGGGVIASGDSAAELKAHLESL